MSDEAVRGPEAVEAQVEAEPPAQDPPFRGREIFRHYLLAGHLDVMDGLINIPDEFGLDQADPIEPNDGDNLGLEAIIPNFAARIGLNETALTRALGDGDFKLAEDLIVNVWDPEYLNDGVHSATPLTLALSGRSAYCGQPRNLRIASLLVQRGANVNLRIPGHYDLEAASESPLELLTSFYLSLLKSFKNYDERNHERYQSRRTHLEYVKIDLLDTIGLNDELKMSPQDLLYQTKTLLLQFLEHGGDINLQTTQAGRTVFHMVLAADVLDMDLVERMVTMGGSVNLTDVHGTTPLMDVIECKDPERPVAIYKYLNQRGKALLLDAQNCSGESALFRAMFQGKRSITHLLLDEGASSFSMARVQKSYTQSQCFVGLMSYLHRPPSISNLPSLLAPMLGDSPCLKQVCKRLKAKPGEIKDFSVPVFNQIVRQRISPFIDLGWFCTREVERTVHELVKVHTSFGHLTEAGVFQEIAIIPMLYGDLAGGLRQLCIRKLLNTAIFESAGTSHSNLDDSIPIFTGMSMRKSKLYGRQVRSASEPVTSTQNDDSSACVVVCDSSSQLSHSFSQMRLDAPPSEQPPVRGQTAWIGGNWLLQKAPEFKGFPSSPTSGTGTIQRKLSSSDEDQVPEALPLTPDCFPGSASCSSDNPWESDTSDSLKDSEDDHNSSGEAFSYGNVFYANKSNSQSFRSPSHPWLSSKHEKLIKWLNPERVAVLAGDLGLPPSLRPLLELEVARLELALAVFEHRSIQCDRGCEGDDDTESSSDESSWGPDSLSGPSLTPTESPLDSSLEDIESDLSYDPSVPVRPRMLSPSSSSESDYQEGALVAPAEPRALVSDRAQAEARGRSSPRDGWFTFQGGDEEEETTRRYVTSWLDECFDLSTDSSTSSSSSSSDSDSSGEFKIEDLV